MFGGFRVSILTRVFCVALSLLSVVFASAAVSIVAQQNNWKKLSDKYREHARVADTNLRHEIAASAAQLASAREDVRAQRSNVGRLETDLQGARNKVAQLRSEVARVAAEKSSADALNRGLLAQLQSSEASRTEYQKQRDQLETSNIDLSQRNFDMNDRVNELTAQLDVQLEQKRYCDQQINILRSENDRLARAANQRPIGGARGGPGGAVLPNVRAQTPLANRAIRGQVVDFSGQLLTISVGSADGVKENMVFVITRNDEYVGDVQVTLVKPDEAAGRLITSSLKPEAGDMVVDALAMGGSRG